MRHVSAVLSRGEGKGEGGGGKFRKTNERTNEQATKRTNKRKNGHEESAKQTEEREERWGANRAHTEAQKNTRCRHCLAGLSLLLFSASLSTIALYYTRIIYSTAPRPASFHTSSRAPAPWPWPRLSTNPTPTTGGGGDAGGLLMCSRLLRTKSRNESTRARTLSSSPPWRPSRRFLNPSAAARRRPSASPSAGEALGRTKKGVPLRCASTATGSRSLAGLTSLFLLLLVVGGC